MEGMAMIIWKVWIDREIVSVSTSARSFKWCLTMIEQSMHISIVVCVSYEQQGVVSEVIHGCLIQQVVFNKPVACVIWCFKPIIFISNSDFITVGKKLTIES